MSAAKSVSARHRAFVKEITELILEVQNLGALPRRSSHGNYRSGHLGMLSRIGGRYRTEPGFLLGFPAPPGAWRRVRRHRVGAGGYPEGLEQHRSHLRDRLPHLREEIAGARCQAREMMLAPMSVMSRVTVPGLDRNVLTRSTPFSCMS